MNSCQMRKGEQTHPKEITKSLSVGLWEGISFSAEIVHSVSVLNICLQMPLSECGLQGQPGARGEKDGTLDKVTNLSWFVHHFPCFSIESPTSKKLLYPEEGCGKNDRPNLCTLWLLVPQTTIGEDDFHQ